MPDTATTPNTADTKAESSSNININSPYVPRYPTPLVSISINHPFATAAKKIKNFLIHKQTLFSTSFTIKVTPIVAIVSLFGLASIFGGGVTTAFTFGKTVEQRFLASVPKPKPTIIVLTPTPGLVSISKVGTIQATYGWQEKVAISPTNIPLQNVVADASLSTNETITPTLMPTITPVPVLHYILVSRSGGIIFLSVASTVKLKNYQNLRVLVTGNFDSTKNTMTIQKPEDIEILQ